MRQTFYYSACSKIFYGQDISADYLDPEESGFMKLQAPGSQSAEINFNPMH